MGIRRLVSGAAFAPTHLTGAVPPPLLAALAPRPHDRMHDYWSHALVFLSPSPLDTRSPNAPLKFSPAAGPAAGWADIPVALLCMIEGADRACVGAPGAWRCCFPAPSPRLPLPSHSPTNRISSLSLPTHFCPLLAPPASPAHRTLPLALTPLLLLPQQCLRGLLSHLLRGRPSGLSFLCSDVLRCTCTVSNAQQRHNRRRRGAEDEMGRGSGAGKGVAGSESQKASLGCGTKSLFTPGHDVSIEP